MKKSFIPNANIYMGSAEFEILADSGDCFTEDESNA